MRARFEDDCASAPSIDVAKAAAMTATLVLQANDAIHNLPASAVQLRSLMTSHGYPNVQVHEYPGFSRPLLVGIPERIAGAAPRHAEPVSIAL
jgi:hypothetical protein